MQSALHKSVKFKSIILIDDLKGIIALNIIENDELSERKIVFIDRIISIFQN